MPTINRSMIVPYSAAQMYDLVNQIEDYPSFLPWCRRAVVHSHSDSELRATLTLAKGGIEKSFTTHNRMEANQMIDVELVDGPFRHLTGHWTFTSLQEQACKVVLVMEFEFSAKVLSFAFAPVFTQVASTLVDSFCQRARDVYGKG